MKTIELSQLGSELADAVQNSPSEDILVVVDGKRSGYLLWLSEDDDVFDYELTSDPRFKARVEEARKRFAAGRGVSMDEAKRRLGLD